MSELRIESLSVTIREQAILDNVNLSLPQGKLIGLIGPNGAGKSTLLRSCLKLNRAQGNFIVDGKDMLSLKPGERARYLSFLPQERELAWAMNVHSVVKLGLPNSAPLKGYPRLPDADILQNALKLLELDGLHHRQATSLSGGELARVLIARLIAQDTPIILADEPLAGLDPQQHIKVMRIFQSLARSGKTILTSIHDLTQAALWCDHLVLINKGTIVAQGTPHQVLTNEDLRDVYGIIAEVTEKSGRLHVIPTNIIE